MVETPPRKSLDLGCGTDKLPGAIGIDANPRSDADVIHNLDVFPWPFESNTFEYVRAFDVLEHVADFEGCLRELHRVCKSGALIDVRMPFMGSNNFATDPTHRRAGTHRTFEYFEPDKPFGKYRYSEARFQVRSFHYERGYLGPIGSVFRQVDKLLIPFLERHAHEYEAYFTGICPMQNISYELLVIKDARERLARGAVALLVAAPVLSLALHFTSVLGRDLHPGRDHSIYELNTIAFLHGKQLVGPYSQFGWHHLGPAFFAVLAAPYALSGFRSLSLVLTMLAWSTAMIVALVAIARREAGAAGAVVAVIALWAFLEYENRLPLYNYWAPFFTYLAFPLCTALVALVSGNAGSRALAWALALSTVLVQTHIGLAPAIGAFWALAAAVRVLARRRGMTTEPLFTRRAVWVSVAVIAAMWMLPVVAELRGFGNWSRIATFFGSEQRHPAWGVAFDRAAAEIVAPLRRALFGQDAYSYVRKTPPGMPTWRLLAVAYGAALVASVVVAWRARRPFIVTLAGAALVAAALSPLAIRRVVGPIEPHYVAWIAGATVVGLTAIAGAGTTVVAARWPSVSPIRGRVARFAPWVACAAFSAWLATARGFVPEAHLLTPGLARLADRVDARLRSDGVRALVVHGTPVTMPWHFNLGLELYRRGHEVRFAVSRAEFHIGSFWTRPVDARATVHLVSRRVHAKGDSLGCENPPPGSLIVGSVCVWLEMRKQ